MNFLLTCELTILLCKEKSAQLIYWISVISEFNKESFAPSRENRIELRNLEILTKMPNKSSQFLSSVQPCEPKSLHVALNVAGVEKRYGRKTITLNLEAIRFEVWTERSASDGGNLCPLWSVILNSIWNTVGRELYFARCCALKRTETFVSESKVTVFTILTDFKKRF